MAVTDVEALSASASFPAGGGRQYSVEYQVKTDSRNDGPRTVANDSRLPSNTSTYEFGDESDDGAVRIGMPTVKPKSVDGSLKVWGVSVQFATVSSSISGVKLPQVDIEQETYPWDIPAKISGDFIPEEIDYWRDTQLQVVENSAGNLLEPFLKREIYHPTLVIERAYSSAQFSLQVLLDFVNSRNEKPFWGMLPGVWLLRRAPWQELYFTPSVNYYSVAYEFQADETSKWTVSPVDQGYRDQNGAFPTDDTDTIVLHGKMEYLDGAGEFLDPTAFATDPPVYLDGSSGRPGPFYPYKDRDYALLGVPTA